MPGTHSDQFSVISDGDFDASGLFFFKKREIFRNFNEGCSTPASSHRVIAAYIDERRVYTYVAYWMVGNKALPFVSDISSSSFSFSPHVFFFFFVTRYWSKSCSMTFFSFPFRPVCCWQCFQMLRIISTPPRPYFPTKNKRKDKKKEKRRIGLRYVYIRNIA